jgi:hypothetical protein
MPSIKEIYNSIGEVELNADSINLNVDGLEALASTQQADIALIKADVDDIRSDMADGVAITAASLPLPSGAATSANQTTANTSLANLDTDLGAQADASASSDTGTFSLISLFKRLLSRITSLVPANLTVTSTRLLVDGSGVTQPVSGTITANAGTGSFIVAQSTASSLKAQVQVLDSGGSQITYASTGTAGTPASDVVTVQGISGGTPLPVRPRNGAITVTTGTTSSSANTSAQALASNTSRQYLLIQNISDTDMYFNFGAAATTSNLLVAKNGSGIVFESGFVPTDAVNVICSGASKPFYILSA